MLNTIDEWFKVAAKFGLPSLAVIYLIWMINQSVVRNLEEINRTLESHQIDTDYYVKSIDELKLQTDRTNLLLQQICVNGAKLTSQINCFK
jgi:hypothetical protein